MLTPAESTSAGARGGDRSSPSEGVPDPPAPHESARPAKPLPEVPEPSPDEVARHMLTHLPFRRWCKWCVMARKLNLPHKTLPPFSRASPLFVCDYAFLKHNEDERFLTVLIGRAYPSRAMFAVPCHQKGPDEHATKRLASLFRACGMTHFSFMSDQEGAVRTMLDQAVQISKGRGEWVGPVPESSPVGESQSNGRAERAVQQLEDQVRTLLGELEDRIQQSLKPQSPILAWLVEYCAVLLNKYHLHEDLGMTSYEHLHGHAAEEKLAYFGERIYYHVPKRRRSNLDLRWGQGVFLGTLMTSTEAIVGLPSGDVVKTGSMARLIPSQRWRREAILAVRGTPAQPTLGEDDSVIESFHHPHLMMDAELHAKLDDEEIERTDTPLCLQPGRKLPSLRITQSDLLKYQYSDDCPRCIATQFGDLSLNPSHTGICRRRIYRAMYQADDPKLAR